MVASQTSRVLLLSSAALLWVLPSPSRAAAVQAAPAPAASKRQYTPADFARFAPTNALDMLRQVAGFSIREASEERGLCLLYTSDAADD